MLVLIVVMAFGMGVMWNKLQGLESGGTVTTGTQAGAQPAAVGEVAVSQDQIKDVFDKSKIKFGKSNSKVVFLEIADPSCPYCHIAAGHNPELNKQVGTQFVMVKDGGAYVAPVEEMRKLVDSGKAAFAYIYTNGHGNGEMGTKALYCANEKGKFWAVHDLMMSSAGYSMLNDTIKNDKTKSQQLADFLKPAMNASDMQKCLDSGKYDTALGEDTALATSLGVSGTPGFFVNTTRYAGAYSYTDMKSVVDAAL